jgi:hypothetical protein
LFIDKYDKKQISILIIEAFNFLLTSLVNTNQEFNKSRLSVYRFIDLNNSYDEDIFKEFTSKILNIIIDKHKLKKFISWKIFIIRSINEFILDKDKNLVRYSINLLESEDYIELMIDSNLFIKLKRIDRFIKLIKKDYVYFILCVVRYNIYNPYLAFFEMNKSCLYFENVSQFDKLSIFNYSNNTLNFLKKYNINLELFSDPFNNIFPDIDNTFFCSLSYDSDYKFNSIGNFKTLDFNDERCQNIICFMPKNKFIYDDIVKKINKFNNNDKFILLFVPIYIDIDFSKDLIVNKYTIKIKKMYDNLTNKRININGEYYNIYFICKNTKHYNTFINILNDLRDIFK